MKLNKLSLAILGATALAGSAHAATPTLKDVLGASGITASGYVDAAYTSFDTDAGSFSTNYFDSGSRQSFEIKQASVTFASQPTEGFGALVNLTAGNDAQFIHSVGGSTADLDLTQAFVLYSSCMKSLAIKLSKICNDLRLLSSGPRCGLNEINLPPLQPGSSIMPGKVNPVMAELTAMVGFQTAGAERREWTGSHALESSGHAPRRRDSLLHAGQGHCFARLERFFGRAGCRRRCLGLRRRL